LSLAVLIIDASGTRTLAEQDLPLSIGTAPDSVIRIPGPVVRNHSAQLGVLDGRVFVTVTGKDNDVSINGSVISGTRWLSAADVLSVAGAGIRDGATPASRYRRDICQSHPAVACAAH
jgi:hypothetical protein